MTARRPLGIAALLLPIATCLWLAWRNVPPDLLIWTAIVFLFGASIVTSIACVREARRMFNVVEGRRYPDRFVIWGIKILATDLAAIPLTIIAIRIFAVVSDDVPLIQVRTGLFFLFFSAVPVGLGLMAYGFQSHANNMLRVRLHWLHTRGFHGPEGHNLPDSPSLLRRILHGRTSDDPPPRDD